MGIGLAHRIAYKRTTVFLHALAGGRFSGFSTPSGFSGKLQILPSMCLCFGSFRDTRASYIFRAKTHLDRRS
jgi:hypothetical protein